MKPLGHFDPFLESVNILSKKDNSLRKEVKFILEDVNSPVTTTYISKLYDSVISKGHIDFDDIPNTKGDITKYKGYTNILSILDTITRLAETQKSISVKEYAKTIQDSVNRMVGLADLYQLGFRTQNKYVMLEYNTFVYTIIQATSSLLYEFVDYIKRPDSEIIEITLKNTNRRPSLFYIKQLEKFNSIASGMQYRQFLKGMMEKDKDNFIGVDTAIGISAVTTVAIAIIPVTRELVYQFYNLKAKLSDCLAQQAYFLELNKIQLESSKEFDTRKKQDIIKKQEKVRKNLIVLSEKLRVEHVKSEYSREKLINTDNSLLTLKHVKTEVENKPLSLL